jgi:hypothetical protein
MNSFILYMILSDFVLYVNSYIKPNLSTAEAAEVAAVDDSLAAHSMSGVSISYDAVGIIKAELGEEISNVVEVSAPTDAPTAMAVTHTMLDVAVSSVVAVAVHYFVLGKKGVVSGLISAMFCMISCIF